MVDNSNKNAANSQFRKLRQAEEGKRAMLDYENNAAAMRVKTTRLRALRLARDAEEAAAAGRRGRRAGEEEGGEERKNITTTRAHTRLQPSTPHLPIRACNDGCADGLALAGGVLRSA